jgi:hypothetical protein
MKIYDKTYSFKCDKEMKDFLIQLRKNKVNVSKFIRDSIEKNKPIKKTSKPNINQLKKMLNEVF